MKITTNKHGDCHLRWQYDNKENPLQTKLFLEKDRNTVIKEISVKKHHSDKNDKNLARKFSLNKLLKEEFDGKDNKADRIIIWDTYLNRKTNN